ncbi:MAG: CmcJ/NvfI family oxidoreductase [Novosphingobium sp.]
MSPAAAEVETTIDYLIPTSRINRRFWAPGKEYNTGVYQPYPVTIRNARLAGPFTLDQHGFCIARHQSAITAWEANYGGDSAYAAEVADVVKRLTGADLVVNMGGMVRSSGLTSATVQPPAAEAHVDFTTRSANRIAEALYRKVRPEGAGYDRFISYSLWRCLHRPGPCPHHTAPAACPAAAAKAPATANRK